ncbi:AbrB family transcriptional regulator [uncultured Lactobacillus sp.]|nr:AbrB family transcriptional regulator [uncultured Lactobacillus sp.]
MDHVDLPTALEWSNLVIELFEEKVEEIDKNENYDPKKSPNFHDWLVNG